MSLCCWFLLVVVELTVPVDCVIFAVVALVVASSVFASACYWLLVPDRGSWLLLLLSMMFLWLFFLLLCLVGVTV